MEARDPDSAARPVAFELILKPAGGTADTMPGMASVERFRPPPEAAVRCQRWLHAQGVSCHDAGFSVACEAPKDRFESLFGVTLHHVAGPPGTSSWRTSSDPRIPEPIADLVDEVVLPPPPIPL